MLDQHVFLKYEKHRKQQNSCYESVLSSEKQIQMIESMGGK